MKKITHTLSSVIDLVGRKFCNHVYHTKTLRLSSFKRIVVASVILLFCASNTLAQNVTIPDANFKAYLVGNTSINTNADSEIQVSEATAFTGTIDCSNLNITDLTGIEAFTALTSLLCFDNQLTSIDVNNNTALLYLYAYNNPITALDISNNTALLNLFIQNTQLTTLDVSQNTSLSQLLCYDNQLSTLNLGNTGIEYIWCYNNQLTELDVSQSSSLIDLRFDNNQLTSLDVSQNSNLTILIGNDNLLTELNAANGNNTNFTQFDVTNNSSLDCIQVDDATYSTNNWTNIDAGASFSESCPEWCTVNIPDANFKAYLIGNTSINTNGDSEIQCDEASSFTGVINCKDLDITDLTGLEAFTSLTQLICGGNPSLTSMDVSQNTALFSINVTNASLTSLDVSNNTALKYLQCSSNQLTSLDLSQNTQLLELNCGSNSISSLDLSNNTSLEHLRCYSNQLSALDVSQNAALTQLFIYNNDISELDVTNNTALEYLYTFDNPIITLDVTNNASLIYLYCHNSQLTSLDVSNSPDLIQLTCYNNQLTQLNVANGNNAILTVFDASDNPNLSCIQVDDAAYSTANWTDIDAGASFSEDCTDAWTPVNIPDANFKAALLANASINTTDDGEITYAEAEAFAGTMNVSNESISDLTGIEAFINLTALFVNNNDIGSIDVSNNIDLQNLQVENCGLSSGIDISALTELTAFNGRSNGFTSIDLSNNTKLSNLRLESNELSSLDLSANTMITQLRVANNPLAALDVSAQPDLTTLYADNTQITELDVSGNSSLHTLSLINGSLTSLNVANGNNSNFVVFTVRFHSDLSCITVDDVTFSESNWSDPDNAANFSTDCNVVDIPDDNFRNALLAEASINTIDDAFIQVVEAEAFTGTINVSNQSIEDLTGIEAFTEITNLVCSNNLLTSLDISANTKLSLLNAQNNDLTELDISNNVLLESLDFGGNQISSIDVSSNTQLTYLGGYENQLTSIDLSNNALLIDLGLYQNQLTSLDISVNSDLIYLDASNNQLTSANAANGNNVIFEQFYFNNNPNLTCITVDDVAYAEANFTDVDATANFSTNCNNTANDITVFSFAEQAIDAIIDATNHTVVIDVVSDTDMSNLTPTFTISAGATADPASGVAQDFSSAFVYTITAENPTAIQEWTITVREENVAPTDITLNNTTIDENNALDAVIGTFSSTDANTADTHTYSLVAGTGDNVSFDISGSNLIALESFDFETKSSYSVRVQTDDGRGGTFEKEFTISINDLEDRSEQTITFEPIENQFLEAGSITLSASASSGLEVSYEIVSGPATVSGNVVSFSDIGTVVVSASQAGNGTFLPAEPVEQSFEIITVTGFEDEASALIIYPNPASEMLTVQAPQDNITLQLLNIGGSKVMNVRPNVGNDISHLDNGIYFLRITNTQGTSTYKIIKN